MVINGFGAVCTAVVMLVFAATKFSDGAYVVLFLIPALVGHVLGDPSSLSKSGQKTFP